MSFRAGFVGLVGMPNAGKSTLVNALIGEKVSIVTSKPQTTRRKITGIAGDDDCQAIFVDAPGVVHSQTGLNEFLETEYRSVMRDSDILLAVLNLDEKKFENILRVLRLVRECGKPWVAVITKRDLGSPERIGTLKAELLSDNVPQVVVCALKEPKETAKEILEVVKTLLPEAEGPIMDPELLTTENLRDMVAEIIREKCFEEIKNEVPYGLGIKMQSFKEVDGRPTVIIADVIVEKMSHKPIVIGKSAERIKKIGMLARQDVEELLETKVFLELHVVVKEKWTKNKSIMRDLGYVIQE